MRMNKKEKIVNPMPKFRFPEFSNDKGWHQSILREIYDEISQGGTPNTSTSDFWNGSINWLTPAEMGKSLSPYIQSTNRKITDLGLKNCSSSLLPVNSVIISTRAPIGYVGINLVPLAINQGCKALTPNSRLHYLFLYYFLKINVNRLSNLGAGNTFKELSTNALKSFNIYYPSNQEQQKIADCLSSLDELIIAEDKKLELLRAHKKGLMQKLFPAEGKSVPEWRFPEFRGDGEWEEKKFGKLCEFIRGPFGGALKKEIFVKDGYAVYEQSHAINNDFNSFRYRITDEKYHELKRFAVHAGDIIMSCSGTMGKFAIIPKESEEGVINQALLKLTAKKGVDVQFTKMTLELEANQDKLLSQSAGGAIKNVVAVSQMKEMLLLMPQIFEQQRIADCLSGVDDLITEQAKKIDALKTHKKGLMQGLFPSVEEVRE